MRKISCTFTTVQLHIVEKGIQKLKGWINIFCVSEVLYKSFRSAVFSKFFLGWTPWQSLKRFEHGTKIKELFCEVLTINNVVRDNICIVRDGHYTTFVLRDRLSVPHIFNLEYFLRNTFDKCLLLLRAYCFLCQKVWHILEPCIWCYSAKCFLFYLGEGRTYLIQNHILTPHGTDPPFLSMTLTVKLKFLFTNELVFILIPSFCQWKKSAPWFPKTKFPF